MKTTLDKQDQIIKLLTEIRDNGKIGMEKAEENMKEVRRISEESIMKNKQLYTEYLVKHQSKTKMFLIVATIMIAGFLIFNSIKFY